MKIIHNNKKIYLLVIINILILIYSNVLFAKNNVPRIDIDVLIHDNGSATITQMWQGTFDQGTEIYIPIEDKSLIVKNLNVSRNGREYLHTEDWDTNASFDDKKHRCGIKRTDKGVELCFGITEYGNNAYVFSYDIDPLVKSYDESDGFNFQFLNPGMDIYPSSVNLRLRLENQQAITNQNARIWGFGFDGQVDFSSNGYAVAFTNTKLNSYNYVTILLELYKGLISPNVKVDGTFEDLKNIAFIGSDYKKTLDDMNTESGFSLYDLIPFIFFGSILLAFIANIISKIKRKNQLKNFYKKTNYFRDTPNGGDIAMSYALFNDYDIWHSKESNVIGAIIMKMINDKNLELMEEKSYAFLGKEKTNICLKIGNEPSDPLLKELYDIIIKASGDDGILQENELKKYSKANYNILNNYLDSIYTKGHNSINSKECYNNIIGKKLGDLNAKGQNELGEVYGLRKFLDEFSLISERDIAEGVIWENLMVYATLFGVAKKVLSELKKVYPDRVVEIENYANTYYVSDVYFRTLYYSSLNAKRANRMAQMSKMAASGFGGAVSIGGGGGFSGGGSGGGTR